MKVVTTRGRLVRAPVSSQDPETKEPIAFATIEVKTGRRDHEHAEKEYVDLVFMERSAKRMLDYGKPNLEIFVTGREHLKHFTRRDGTPDAANEIFVTSWEPLFAPKG